MSEIQDFCRQYVRMGNLEEACAFLNIPREQGEKILFSRKGRRTVASFQQMQMEELKNHCISGMYRLAFNKANDAVILAQNLNEGKCSEIGQMDLFGITELKQNKTGVEIKFHDRQKALEQLYAYASLLSEQKNAKELFEILRGEDEENGS